MNTEMNIAKAETSIYLTLQERIIRLSPHTVVVILVPEKWISECTVRLI